MEQPAADMLDPGAEKDGTLKANDEEKKPDYSSKAENKTAFSHYLVPSPSSVMHAAGIDEVLRGSSRTPHGAIESSWDSHHSEK